MIGPINHRTLIIMIIALCMILITHFSNIMFDKRNVDNNNDNNVEDVETDVRAFHFDNEQATNNTNIIHEKRHIYHDLCDNTSVTREELLQYLHSFYSPIVEVKNEQQIKDEAEAELNEQQKENEFIYDFSNNTRQCIYTFLDVGVQGGNTLRKFIETGMVPCQTKFILEPQYDILSHSIVNHQQYYGDENGIGADILDEYDIEDQKEINSLTNSRLSLWLRKVIDEHSNQISKRTNENKLQPEDYCYYGIEGNPYYNKILYEIEKHIMIDTSIASSSSSIQDDPRPVRLVHYFTETVMTNITGPMTLYVHTNNTNSNHYTHNNAWKNHPQYYIPSNVNTISIMTTEGQKEQENEEDIIVATEEEMNDAVLEYITTNNDTEYYDNNHNSTDENNFNSNENNNNDIEEIHVNAITLTSLIPQIVIAQPGSHLIIKFDIEGGEYVILNEASTSNILCQLSIDYAVRIDILLEMHKVCYIYFLYFVVYDSSIIIFFRRIFCSFCCCCSYLFFSSLACLLLFFKNLLLNIAVILIVVCLCVCVCFVIWYEK